MRVEVETVDSVRRRLRIVIPGDRVRQQVEETYRNLQKTVRIPGFRKGRVPRGILRARFGDAVRSEVLDELVPDAVRQAIDERGLEVISRVELNPALEEMELPEDGSDLEFVAEVAVKPEITLPDFSELQIDKTPVDVSEEELNEYLHRLQDAYAELEDPSEPRPAQTGDVVFTDWKLIREDRPEPVSQQENYAIEIGKEQVLPEIETALIGMQVGETKEVPIRYPEDYPNEQLAGQTARMVLTVKRIAIKRLPELDDNFAKMLNYESFQAMRAAYWNRLVEARKQQKRAEQRQELLDQLVEKTEFPVPESVIREEAQSRAVQELTDRQRRGESVENLDVEELVASMQGPAERAIRERWILDAIAQQEGIEVSDTEVRAAVVAEARQRGEDPDRLEEQLRSTGGWEGYRRMLRDARIIDLLIERAQQRPVILTP